MEDIVTDNGYTIRLLKFDDGDVSLQKVIDLQNIVYAGQHVFHIEPFRNWYLNNPMGKVISFNAFYGTELVAHYACSPYRMKIGDRIVNGVFDLATVTHPEHRGKGLFKQLAKVTYDYVKEQGYEFVIGVANANSFPGYMKYFPFTFVGQLDVKIGWGNNITMDGNKLYSVYWDKESINWRTTCCKGDYSREKNAIIGWYRKGIQTFMGTFDNDSLDASFLQDKRWHKRPRIYVGLGAKSKSPYFTVPSFVKHSPFNLIFLDLTGGNLPPINKENIFFQLFDFDVA